MPTDSAELQQIEAEAADIAKSVAQRPSTAHLLLAIFTVPGAADQLLRERGLSEDAVLAQLSSLGRAPDEAPELYASALDRARQLAADCGHAEAEGLHLLVALTRLSRTVAAGLLDATTPPVSSLRTTALGQLLGSIPRRRARGAAESIDATNRAPPRALDALPRGRTSTLPSAAGFPGAAAPQPSTLSHGPRTAVADLPAVSRAPGPSLAPGPALAPSPSTRPPASTPQPAQAPSPGPASALESALSTPPAPSAAPPATPAAARWALDPRQFPWLHTHGKNLTLLAALDGLDLAVGRESEVEEVLDILGKRRANNPVLVGEPGVGKTAIVEGLARRLVQLAGPESSGRDRVLMELDVAGLVAGTQLRGSFSERLIGLKEEVKRAEGRVIVFIDELHMLIGAGSTGEGPQDAANELKAALSRGEFPCIGATTHDEFRKHIQGDPALERRFVPVLVREPSPRATRDILDGAKGRYELHHQVTFAPDALEAACTLTARYVRDRFLPDKAFAAIDLAGSRARREGRTEVVRDDVARAVARMAGLPEERLLQPDGERFLTLDRRLRERIVGHERVLESISRVLKRNQAGFSGQRPLASMVFVGPSGVGKTETARALAEELFPAGPGEAGSASGALVRIDLSEYSEPHSVSRLVGAAPGYVGYGEGGQLTEAVRRRPACLVLFDEAEKAHPSVLQLLLQILEEGQLSDGRGRRVDFTAAILVLTSNAGAAAFGAAGTRPMGFGSAGVAVGASELDPLAQTLPPTPVEHPLAGKALELARASFPPELWARFDERLVFASLSREEVARVAQLLLAESSRRLWEERRIAFRTGPGLIDALVAAGGYVPALGARPMQKTIERLVESPLADRILAGTVRSGERLLACAGPQGIEFRKEG